MSFLFHCLLACISLRIPWAIFIQVKQRNEEADEASDV